MRTDHDDPKQRIRNWHCDANNDSKQNSDGNWQERIQVLMLCPDFIIIL